MTRVSTLLAAIPERTVRSPSGTPLRLPRDAAAQQAPLAYLARHLSWLTPFSALDDEGQRALGLLAVRERPEREDDDADGEAARAPSARRVAFPGSAQSGRVRD